MNYHLCSAAVIHHMQPSEVSRPFFSGYEDDNDRYYVARFDYEEAETYYMRVIYPYNERSRVGDIDFWFRTCDPNHLPDFRITLKDCRRLGLFRAIEQALNLTNETNRALAIYSLSEQFGCTPIEFINKIAPQTPTNQQEKLRDEFLQLVAGQVDRLTRNGHFPIHGVKPYPVLNYPILDLGKKMGRYVMQFNRLSQAVLDC